MAVTGLERRTFITGAALAPLAATGIAVAEPSTAAAGARRPRRPVVIGHRGTAGYRPEHTLASYELAARMGADFMEPDLVVTRDGHLVCRHEPAIGGTTDVAKHPEFAGRKTTKTLDGVAVTDWFTTDFTLAELKTLRAVERLPGVRQENTMYDGFFEIPTFDEVVALRSRISKELRRDVGIYPETKHPTFFRKLGLPLEERLLKTLDRAGLNHPDAPVYVQSFEVTNLQQLRRAGLRTRSTQLLSATGSPYDSIDRGIDRTYADIVTPSGLRDVARYAEGIGPDKLMVIPLEASGNLGKPTPLVDDAHAAGLVVHPYTFRAENSFLPADYRSDATAADYGRGIDEQVAYLEAGLDGLFTDQTDIGVLARSLVHPG